MLAIECITLNDQLYRPYEIAQTIIKSKKNKKLFTFYVENGNLNPKNTPTPQTCLLLILQKKYLRYMVYYFN